MSFQPRSSLAPEQRWIFAAPPLWVSPITSGAIRRSLLLRPTILDHLRLPPFGLRTAPGEQAAGGLRVELGPAGFPDGSWRARQLPARRHRRRLFRQKVGVGKGPIRVWPPNHSGGFSRPCSPAEPRAAPHRCVLPRSGSAKPPRTLVVRPCRCLSLPVPLRSANAYNTPALVAGDRCRAGSPRRGKRGRPRAVEVEAQAGVQGRAL